MNNKQLFLFFTSLSFSFIVLYYFWYYLALLESWIVSKVINCQISNNIIYFKDQKYIISWECSGIVSISILIAIIVSDDYKRKFLRSLVSVFLIFILNLLRIIASIIYGEFIHTLFWFLIPLEILLIWYGLSELVNRKSQNSS